jgi:hypothetical protein
MEATHEEGIRSRWMRTRRMNVYLNTKIIVGTILGLENNRKVVVHHISTGIKHHVHQGRLPFVD